MKSNRVIFYDNSYKLIMEWQDEKRLDGTLSMMVRTIDGMYYKYEEVLDLTSNKNGSAYRYKNYYYYVWDGFSWRPATNISGIILGYDDANNQPR